MVTQGKGTIMRRTLTIAIVILLAGYGVASARFIIGDPPSKEPNTRSVWHVTKGGAIVEMFYGEVYRIETADTLYSIVWIPLDRVAVVPSRNYTWPTLLGGCRGKAAWGY